MSNTDTPNRLHPLNVRARELAGEIAAKFPGMTPEQIRFFARFAAVAPEVINACNAALAPQGKELSPAGLTHCLERAAELAARG